MGIDLKWGDPPPEALGRIAGGFYGQIAKMLKDRPDEWAQVPREFASESSAKSAAANIRWGRVMAMPKGEFEAAAHGKFVWVKYVSEPQDDGSADDDAKKAYPAKVRAWAKLNGVEIPQHGRIPNATLDRYAAATGDSRPEGS